MANTIVSASFSGKMYTTDPYGSYIDTWERASHSYLTKTERTNDPKPSGWLYPKPYFMSHHVKKRPQGILQSRRRLGYPVPTGWDYTTITGCLGSYVDAGADLSAAPSSENLRNESIIKALMKLNTDNVNFGVALAESKQVANFVTSVYGRIAASASWMLKATSKKTISRTLRNKYRKQAARELHKYKRGFQSVEAGSKRSFKKYKLDKAPGTWLEWQYAVKPLMSDATTAVKQLAVRDNLDEWVITVKHVVKNTSVEIGELLENPNLFAGVRTKDEYFTGYFTRLDYVPKDPLLIHLQRTGLLNVPLIIHEKTWMSFVLDWAFPLGEWLAHLTAAVGFEFKSGSTSELRKTMRTYVLGDGAPTSGAFPVEFLQASWTGSQYYVRLDRTVHISSPLIPFPRIKNPLSMTHVANGLSLLAVIAKGRY